MKPLIPFSRIVQDFFQRHLVGERNLSPHTVFSYRDAMKLLIQSVGRSLHRSPDRLALEDFDAPRIRMFLEELERERHCSPRTRNQRLAAIKTFFRYVASLAPEHLERCRQIREIATRRVSHKAISYMEQKAMETILAGIDLRSPTGLRDRALLTLLYNTGARVQEIVDLGVTAIRFAAPAKVRLMGKGRKERDCPLWNQTVDLLRRYISQRRLPENSNTPLFINSRGQRLTRHGVAYILRRSLEHTTPHPEVALPTKLTPHIIRHTTAMELLRAGVDITVIAAWLGHVDLRTTHQYVEIDLRMKHAAIAESNAGLLDSFETGDLDSTIIEWLDALGKGIRVM
jgi:site-specific recombinase XerD